MKLEEARNAEGGIKAAVSELNEMIKAASVQGLIVELETTSLHFIGHEHDCPVLLCAVKIKPSEIE